MGERGGLRVRGWGYWSFGGSWSCFTSGVFRGSFGREVLVILLFDHFCMGMRGDEVTGVEENPALHKFTLVEEAFSSSAFYVGKSPL